MRHQSGRLLQQQAALRRGGRQPAAAPFFHQMLVIFARLEAQQRQPEAILPAHLAMTAAGIAAELGENRHDLIGEIDRRIIGEMRDGHGDRSLLAARRLGP